MIRSTALRLHALLLIGIISTYVVAANRVAVENVATYEADGTTRMDISFSCPNRYLDYYPQVETDYLQINLQRMEQCRHVGLPPGPQEVDIPGGRVLVAMEYQVQRGDEAVLRISFEHAIHVLVSQSGNQRQLSITILTKTGRNPEEFEPAPRKAAGSRLLNEAQLESLMDEARIAFEQGNYNRSIQIYTRVLRAQENASTTEALELLGLSRERNGQIAHAVAEYQHFLDRYPQSEGFDRVSQRLAGLITANKSPKPQRQGTTEAKTPGPWNRYGGVSQYYRRDTFKLDDHETINAQSSVLTNVDVMLRRRGARFDLSGRASLGNMLDLLGSDKGPGSQTRLYQGYLDLADETTGLSGRMGRQTLRGGGVLGRFDGLHLAWEFGPGKRFNLMAGYPVDTTSDGFRTHRHFLGAAMDFEQVADLFDVSVFYNTQKIDGVEDRQAVGTEIRYFDDSKSLIALADYDIGFKTLNNLAVLGNWSIRSSLTLSASIDHRTSPFLTTRNALIGQSVTDISDLLPLLSADEIRQMAKDHTGSVRSIHVGASQSLSERLRLNADVTMTEFDSMTLDEGSGEMPDQASQYYFMLNLVGSRLLTDGDTSIFGLRHIDSKNSSTSTLSVDSRFPMSRKFRINPRMRVSLRDNKVDDSDALIVSPSLRLLYRMNRRYRLDFEAGNEWINRRSNNDFGDRTSWFLYFGYRADF